MSPLRPIQPVTVARLPPAKTRLAPLQPINKGIGAPKDHSIPLEAYNIELSDSLSSLGTDSDDDLRQSGMYIRVKFHIRYGFKMVVEYTNIHVRTHVRTYVEIVIYMCA